MSLSTELAVILFKRTGRLFDGIVLTVPSIVRLIDLQSVTDSTADTENEIRGALDEGVPMTMSVTHRVNVKKWPCQDTCIRLSCQDTCIGQP